MNVVIWIIGLHEMLDFRERVLFVALDLMDQCSDMDNDLRVVATTCLLIASKLEEMTFHPVAHVANTARCD
jgi:hypothetical protein